MNHLWFQRGGYASKKVRRYIEREFSPEKIKKIAVIRHAALGDQVIARPFLIEVRKFFPNAEITLVGVSNYRYGMPSDLADITLVMAGREQKGTMSLGDRLRDFRQLPPQDIIFDVAGTSRSRWMTLFSKATLKVGFPYRPYFGRALYNVTVFRSDFQPELECMLDMLKLLGHNPSRPLDFGYPSHLSLYDTSSPTPAILYFNGASSVLKILPQAQMREVLEIASRELPGYQHVYLEGKNDYEKGDCFLGLTERDNVSIQPCLPLDGLIDRVARARLVVSPDTGVRNVAVSTHTPSVGIFYSTVPFRYTPLDGRHHIVMQADGAVPSTEQIVAAIKGALG
ncbi:glycosyltransferase family 9 protein [Desulfoluna butyratoxydans]|uniref:Glycosyl transferase family 9 n=1 Tax=Desulfoluna butyratoxydans TaxID=231438 RepID=A0A4U8YJE6_9BACT|nr:glycosyltransferase family 9 protein [Desulfoluna butyratoxydans]VFQ43540.1 glycosyl transferase family 9 [Desulfoluna butyratoxydans]